MPIILSARGIHVGKNRATSSLNIFQLKNCDINSSLIDLAETKTYWDD